MNVPPTVLTRLHVQNPVFLGGCLNHHWRVQHESEVLVLRRSPLMWAEPYPAP